MRTSGCPIIAEFRRIGGEDNAELFAGAGDSIPGPHNIADFQTWGGVHHEHFHMRHGVTIKQMGADVRIGKDAVAARESFALEVGHRVEPETSPRSKGRNLNSTSPCRLLPCGSEGEPVFSRVHGPARRCLWAWWGAGDEEAGS
jgi:hypothetical protein